MVLKFNKKKLYSDKMIKKLSSHGLINKPVELDNIEFVDISEHYYEALKNDVKIVFIRVAFNKKGINLSELINLTKNFWFVKLEYIQELVDILKDNRVKVSGYGN